MPLSASEGASPGGARAGALSQILSGRGLLIGAGAALLLAILGVVIVVRLLLEGGSDATQPVRWLLRSEPSEAEVVDATGQVLGKTPFQYTHARSSQIDVLSVRKDGYTEQRAPIDCSRDGDVVLTLVATAESGGTGSSGKTDQAPPPGAALAVPSADDPPAKGTKKGNKREHRKRRR